MKLPKKRLAELLVEKDNPISIPTVYIPYSGQAPHPSCYEPDGICTNPQRDCINCPKRGDTNGILTTTDTTGSTINAHIENPLDYQERLKDC